MQFSSKPTKKTFTSLRNHNIKKRFNIWQENKETGEVQAGHLSQDTSTLDKAIAKAKEYQEFSDKCEQGKYIYHVDVEILIEDSEGKNLMEDGDIAYAITVYPHVNDFCETNLW